MLMLILCLTVQNNLVRSCSKLPVHYQDKGSSVVGDKETAGLKGKEDSVSGINTQREAGQVK